MAGNVLLCPVPFLAITVAAMIRETFDVWLPLKPEPGRLIQNKKPLTVGSRPESDIQAK